MRHEQYREWLQLLIYDELTPEEHAALDRHLADCAGCRQELEDLKQFHATLLQAGPVAPDNEMLREARQALRSALSSERGKSVLWSRVAAGVLDFTLPKYKLVLGSCAILAVGILAGRLAFSPVPRETNAQLPPMEKTAAFLDGDTRIANVRFIESDANSGQVEFTCDAVSPVHIKGNINDERVQKVLAHALVNDENPGVRLRSVNAFSTQIQKLKMPDREVKAALILALKTDGNPGVRKEALKTLQGFPFDEEIKQAFLHVLMRDNNPALRIAAINSLDSTRVQGQGTDKDFLEVLKERMQSDENNYIRIRAKSVLEEIKQQ